jgi:sulfur carrier protein
VVKLQSSRFFLERTGILMLSSCHMEAFSLIINGESRSFPTSMSVAGLIESLGYAGKRVAIERNGEIVPRSKHPEVVLENGDKLEIVVAVGGG